jgi:hypothetical protein
MERKENDMDAHPDIVDDLTRKRKTIRNLCGMLEDTLPYLELAADRASNPEYRKNVNLRVRIREAIARARGKE